MVIVWVELSWVVLQQSKSVQSGEGNRWRLSSSCRIRNHNLHSETEIVNSSQKITHTRVFLHQCKQLQQQLHRHQREYNWKGARTYDPLVKKARASLSLSLYWHFLLLLQLQLHLLALEPHFLGSFFDSILSKLASFQPLVLCRRE